MTRAPAGFTLLELLVVVAIMATVGSSLVVGYGDTIAGASVSVAQTELLQLREALVAFERDTGHLPGTGPFALSTEGGAVDPTTVPCPHADWPGNLADRIEAFHSPVNVGQLVWAPTDTSGQPVMPWDPMTGRGWRGPYLVTGGEGFVSVAAFDPTADDALAWDPALQAGAALTAVPAVADPFVSKPLGGLLSWQVTPGGAPLVAHGRPYLFFARYPVPGLPVDQREPALVSTGPNGRYLDPVTALPDDDNLVAYLHR